MLRIGRRISRAIHKGFTGEDSVDVSETDGVRALYLGSETMQSAMRVKAPYELELTYSRAMLLFLLFASNARQVLMVGLGGGSVAKYIHHFLPDFNSRVVEINPRVIQIAHSHFYLPDNDERLEVIEGDGVAYLEQNTNTADVLLLDVFDSQGVPPDMYNQAFFDSCAEALTLDGMMAVNLWGSDKNFDIYLQRIEQSFNQRVLVLRTGRPGNIVVFGFKRSPKELRWASLRDRAKQLEQDHKIEFLEFVEKLRDQNPSTNHRLLLGE
ncbi:MAG TPA: polyamine aminopropyltransferase [Methylophilaceae bacterium]|nr:polyamine aminopropyltransferase [Methylophilaceae bacterium]